MKMNQLRDILAVAERGSLRAAARTLGVAQPAITRSIRELERELGTTLFERHAKGVVPTAMGQLFIQRAQSAQNELQRAFDEIAQLEGGVSGSISACLSTAAHIALLPHALVPFRQRYSEVALDMSESLYPAAEPKLRNSSIDFYVGPLPEQPLAGDLCSETLFKNKRVILARKGHPLTNAKSLKELAGCEWITTTTTVKAEEELGPLFERHNLPRPKITVVAHSALTMLTMAAYSDLLTMLPIQWANAPWTQSLLQTIDIDEQLSGPAICIVRKSSLPLTPAAEYFCDLLRRASVEVNQTA